jgi:hypothetical protein
VKAHRERRDALCALGHHDVGGERGALLAQLALDQGGEL